MRKQRGRVYVYENKNSTWRVEIRRPGSKRTTQTFQTESEAQAVASAVRKQFTAEEMPVSEAVAKYQRYMEREGLTKENIKTTGYRLGNMFPDGDMPLSELHKWSAQSLYDDLVDRSTSVSTQRNTLNQARRFCKWLVKKGHFVVNPFAEVEGVGKRKKRKKQLTIDESRKLIAWCAARPDDLGATATMCCLLLALRSSEVASLTPRCLDDGGCIVRVEKSKTAAGERLVEVPELLRPRMAPLVTLDIDRHWMSYHIRRCCREAEVTEVGPHALRGTHATLATSAGATSQLVASTLGHANTAVTEAHYTEPQALDSSKQQVALKVLMGGAS